jgi:hypothetical protein
MFYSLSQSTILAILRMPFGCVAPKNLKIFDFERTAAMFQVNIKSSFKKTCS